MTTFKERFQGFQKKTKETTDILFPERQIVLRTDGDLKYVSLSKRFQMSVAGVSAAFLLWSGFTSVSHFLHQGELTAKDQEILSVQVAYRSLLNEVTEYQTKFTSINNELEANHTLLVAGLDQKTLENKDKLVSAEAARKEAQIARKHLNTQLHSIEESMRELANRNYSLKGDLSLKEMDLQTALAERNTARLQKKRLEEKLGTYEIQIARLNHKQEDLINKITDRANEEIADIENIMTIAGLDPNKLFGDDEENATATGGPFIAAFDKDGAETVDGAKVQTNAFERHLARWHNLQDIRQSLPLAQPLDYYYISSRYGKRKDPVNNRWAVHYGLDMAASKKSPIYVTAPGKVKFVGWKGNYGRFIVVDHGNGIETRYGHLHKTLVKKGETVDFRTKIGLVGNSGRSTGSHLHYEIRVKGKNVDPYKFIKAGRHVFEG
jgi:murein DD-endopeptidase MepM/ murein hydrolase activator NlpD